jgi:hypothetical protein
MMTHAPVVPVPAGYSSPNLRNSVEVDVPTDLDLDVESMGRRPSDDPAFFTYAAAAGVYAAQVME